MKNILWSMFSNIQNGQMSKKRFVLQERKGTCELFLNLLWDEGFIMGYTVEENTNKLKILLKYNKGEPAIKKIKCVSKPGSRIFYSVRQLWKIKSSKSFLILSTNEGLKTLTESKRLNLGGEPFIVIL